ncbi:MAG: DciA family protein [Gammaproteobacteria bacterium]|nr:DciA family protein [Gammaproteobacteria bacterium]
MFKPVYRQQTHNISNAIRGSSTLSALTHQVLQSYRVYEHLKELLPMNVWSNIRPGPSQEDTLTLLVNNPGTASLLRQYRQEIEKFLQQQGYGFRRVQLKTLEK